MKKSAKGLHYIFWFGLQDVGILYSRAIIQRTVVVCSAFLEHGLAEKFTVCAHTNRAPNNQNFEFFSNIKNQNKKIKNL
jgi:hypothetical protein